ncbi:MAG: hypothetical protein A2Z14_14110 [Chloroflexi bacterium RBG_16_48_8]|nr:MAG: hypothetical protein A2Z14_14110 [Chloroflexi bacterium RBG_16_48_8]
MWEMSEMSVLARKLPEVPDPDKVIQVIEETFVSLGGNPDYLAGMQTAVPGAGKLFGVKVPLLRKLCKEVIQQYKKEKEGIAKIAEECWSRGSREHQLVALFIFAEIKLSPSERWAIGVRYLPDVGNWESCDQLCMALLGQALAEEPRFMDPLETWLKDPNPWVRRAALVAPVYLRRAKYPPELAEELDRRTLAMASALLKDEEKYIRKAVDWTIREVIERHYHLGLEWLRTEARLNPSKISRSTLRLASKKLSDKDQEDLLSLLEE